METMNQGKYLFEGANPLKSVKYYEIVIKNGYDGDLDELAYDAAHKFGNTVRYDSTASFRHGVIIGDRAEEARNEFEKRWINSYEECPIEGRRKAMSNISRTIKNDIERLYDVRIEIKDCYYY